jgi:hypothetical protein
VVADSACTGVIPATRSPKTRAILISRRLMK